jgi:CheY-like chemotaxis protein
MPQPQTIARNDESATTTRRCLVVDDDPEVRRALKRGLKTSGYEVVEATGGNSGVFAVLHHGPFDVIVSDVDMPHGCGVSMLYRLRCLVNPHSKRFIFHSSDASGLYAHGVPVVSRKGCLNAIEAAIAQLK